MGRTNHTDASLPGVQGTEPRIMGHTGTVGTYGQKRGPQPSALKEAMGDDASCLDDAAMDELPVKPARPPGSAMADDGDPDMSFLDEASDKPPMPGEDMSGGEETEDDNEEGETDAGVDPAVRAAIMTGKNIPAESDPAISAMAAIGVHSKISAPPVPGVDILQGPKS